MRPHNVLIIDPVAYTPGDQSVYHDETTARMRFMESLAAGKCRIIVRNGVSHENFDHVWDKQEGRDYHAFVAKDQPDAHVEDAVRKALALPPLPPVPTSAERYK